MEDEVLSSFFNKSTIFEVIILQPDAFMVIHTIFARIFKLRTSLVVNEMKIFLGMFSIVHFRLRYIFGAFKLGGDMEWTILQRRETFIAAIRKNLENAFASLCICFKYKWRRQEGIKKKKLETWERLHVSQWFFKLRFISGYGFAFRGKIADFIVGCSEALKSSLQCCHYIFRFKKRKAFLRRLVALVSASIRLPRAKGIVFAGKWEKFECEKMWRHWFELHENTEAIFSLHSS